MKRIISILSVVFVVGLLSANTDFSKEATPDYQSTTTNSNQAKSITNVKTYYFHATRRCETCQAVETVAKEAIKEYYGNKVAFTSINRDDEKDNPMIKKYKVSGQTLLIIKGDKVVNLTNYAFMNARTNPDKLKAKIKATIDSMI